MSYLNDNPWPLIILLMIIGIVALLVSERGRTWMLGCVVAAVGIYFLEQVLISPGEEIESAAADLLTAFQSEDMGAIEACISQGSPKLLETARQGLEKVQVGAQYHINSVVAEPGDSPDTMQARIRGAGPITLRSGGYSGNHPVHFRTQWKKEDGTWKLSEVTRLNPVNGREMGMLESQ